MVNSNNNIENKSYNFKNIEKEMLNKWDEINIKETFNSVDTTKKPFYFLQGPPYTSGKLHLGHAWNNCMKDSVIRFKRMQGYDVWNRAGYDMHGLPTANKVQAKFNLKTKEDIINFGLAKFIKECKKFALEAMEVMNDDLKKLAVSMNFDDPYIPASNEYIQGVWYMIKKAYDKNRLYQGLRTTSWCPKSQSALAKHELEYKEITDTSIYVKLKIKNKENEYFVIWTTTPWTIPFNLAIMLNPNFDYVRAKVIESEFDKHSNNILIIAKELLPNIEKVAKIKLKIIEEFKGKDLEGYQYEHPFEKDIKDYEKIRQNHPKLHTVILTEEYCTLDAGTGLVHCAPGCGPEDYEVGHKNNLPAYNVVLEDGKFPDNMGRFSGLYAKTDDKIFVKYLDEDGALLAKKSYRHDYAFSERDKVPIIFRTTKQWFFKVEDLKEQMLELNKKVKWHPKSGKNAFDSWLSNLRDNSITKQRFWGTPAPIWICENKNCKHVEVVANIKDLEKLGANKIPQDLHKPFIDEVTFSCPKCNKTMRRIPDVLDVWIDAGSAPGNCLKYSERKDYFERYFPADFILEGKDQIRGWFNLLMITGIITFNDLTFKNVYMHGMITDVDGTKMSKSLGNVIAPKELSEKYGVDALRLYMSATNAGEDIAFSWDEAKLRHRTLAILWNIHNFNKNLAIELNHTPKEITHKDILNLEQKYILSKLHKTIKEVTHDFENYNLDIIPTKIQELWLELSRNYMQWTREIISTGKTKEKIAVSNTIYTVLINLIKISAPIIPFITEKIYQELNETFNLGLKKSIHYEEYPNYNEELISKTIEQNFETAQNIIQGILAGRDKINLGVRWPLKNVIITIENSNEKSENLTIVLAELSELIKKQTNIQNIEIGNIDYKIKIKKLNTKLVGEEFGEFTGDIMKYVKGKEEELAKELKLKEHKFKCETRSGIKEFTLSLKHFEYEKITENGILIDMKKYLIWLDSTMTEELMAEGFARELTRRIQNIRKEMSLVKEDKINLNLELEEETKKIKELSDIIASKVGAENITINITNINKDNLKENQKYFKIKGKQFTIEIEKI